MERSVEEADARERLRQVNLLLDRTQARLDNAESEVRRLRSEVKEAEQAIREAISQIAPRKYAGDKVGSLTLLALAEYLGQSIKGNVVMTQEDYQALYRRLAEVNGEIHSAEEAGRAQVEILQGKLAECEGDRTRLQQTLDFLRNGEAVALGDGAGEGQMDNRADPGTEDALLMQEVLPKIEERLWPVLQAIAGGKHLKQEIADATTGVPFTAVRDMLEELRRMGVLRAADDVKSGGRGRPAQHFYLTAFGKKVCELRFGEQVERSEQERLSTHGSPEHGALILKVAETLQEMGYQDIEADNDKTTFPVDNGRVVRFDIVARKDGERMHVECERGTHTEEEMIDKINKILQVTTEFWIICPDAVAKEKVKQQYFRWRRDDKRRHKLFIGTVEELVKNRCTVFGAASEQKRR